MKPLTTLFKHRYAQENLTKTLNLCMQVVDTIQAEAVWTVCVASYLIYVLSSHPLFH